MFCLTQRTNDLHNKQTNKQTNKYNPRVLESSPWRYESRGYTPWQQGPILNDSMLSECADTGAVYRTLYSHRV